MQIVAQNLGQALLQAQVHHSIVVLFPHRQDPDCTPLGVYYLQLYQNLLDLIPLAMDEGGAHLGR